MIQLISTIIIPLPGSFFVMLLLLLWWVLVMHNSRGKPRAKDDRAFRTLAEIRDRERTLPLRFPEAEVPDSKHPNYRTGYTIPLGKPLTSARGQKDATAAP
jgi:hypothetical protein